jgi:uncharacterized protein
MNDGTGHDTPTSPTQRPLAVVTGASSGIGLELAAQLVDRGFAVLGCAEDEGLSAALAPLADAGATIETCRADLATYDGVESLVAAVASRPVAALVLNAGTGVGGRFVDTALADHLRLVQLDVVSVVHLTSRLLPAMVARGEGRLLFTASVASLMPGPYYSTYAASKSFVLSFSQSIRHEVKDSGVTVTALLPGPTDTAFFARAGMEDTPVGSQHKDDPAKVAKAGIDALLAGEDEVSTPSLLARAQVAMGKALPDKAKTAVHAAFTKPKD